MSRIPSAETKFAATPYLWVLSLALLVLVSACVRKGPRSYGEGLLEDRRTDAGQAVPASSPDDAPASDGQSVFIVRLTDQSGRHPEGIPVAIGGAVDAIMTSDRNGTIRVEGPSGYYTFQVQVGCFERIEVQAGGSGRGGVGTGQTAEANLAVTWRHRIAPAGPVYSSLTPYWPPGEDVTVRYDVVDRCTQGHPRMPGASYSTFRVEVGGNIRLTRPPVMTADADGFGYVRVACTDEGPAELRIVDSQNPGDRLDLISSDLSAGGEQQPTCRRIS